MHLKPFMSPEDSPNMYFLELQQQNHPELLPGELFLSNVKMERVAAIEAGEDEFYSQYEGVRVGAMAYDSLRRHRPNERPVFHRGYRKSHTTNY